MPQPPKKSGQPKLAIKHRVWLFIAVGVILGSLIGILVWRGLSHKRPIAQATDRSSTSTIQITYSFTNITDTDADQLRQALQSAIPEATEVKSDTAAIVFNTSSDDAKQSFVLPSQPNRAFTNNGQLLIAEPTYYLHLKGAEALAKQAALTTSLQKTFSLGGEHWTYLALGDIIPARDVYTVAKRNGYTYPYLKIADRTKQADLTVANLETTVADGQAYGEGPGMMTFTAPDKALDGLTLAGIDGVNLANNHAMNGGAPKVSQMITSLTSRNIGSFGVAKTRATSMSWTTTVKGLKITHLGYDTVPGNIEPTTTSAGAHRIALKPWGSLSATDLATIQADIRAAKQSADIVIPWFHWGTEYTHQANDEQRRLAQACVDAGADAVIGTHPHWTQGVEWYHDHPIAYSLGNLVFDQNWSEETKRSVALELSFNGKQITGAQLMPAKIDNLVQPHFLDSTDSLYKPILSDIASNSWWQ